MRMHHLLRALAVASLLLTLPACQGGGSGGSAGAKPRVAFVSNNPATFWTIVEAGCRKAEGETGVEVIFRKPDSNDSARQNEIIDSLLTQNIKALAVSVNDPKNQRAYLDEIAARVPLVTQ